MCVCVCIVCVCVLWQFYEGLLFETYNIIIQKFIKLEKYTPSAFFILIVSLNVIVTFRGE